MTESNPESRNEHITSSLNVGGVFLQKQIVNVLKRYNCDYVIEEYPVNIAPFFKEPSFPDFMAMPNWDPHKEKEEIFDTMFKSQNLYERQHSSVDIIARRYCMNSEVTLCIEVKKRNPTYKSWVFVRSNDANARMRTFGISMRPDSFVLMEIPRHHAIGNELYLRWIERPLEYEANAIPLYESVRALKQDYEIEKGFFESNISDVDKACFQACIGTYGVILDSLMDFVQSSNYPSRLNVFIPVVISTNLIAANYNAETIDKTSGQIVNDAISYQNIDLLAYDCTPPNSVRFPMNRVHRQKDPDLRRKILRWRVIIATPKGFEHFMEIIKNNY